jgi:hypothetical protein
MADMDFPISPTVGQQYTSSVGVTYQWNGYAWVVGAYVPGDNFDQLGNVIDQIRIILQDTDASSGQYRYSNDSIVANLNMGLIEAFRLRPDIFLETNYVVPMFSSADLSTPWPIEQQWTPPLIYYAVGMTQLRDDEGTQDTRSAAFLQKFQQTMGQPL